jgi:hypothetical protein
MMERKAMKKIIVLGIVLLPCLSHGADTKCKAVEYADHSELVCVGDEKAAPATGHQGVTAPMPANGTVVAPSGVTAPMPAQETVSTPPGVPSDSAPTTQTAVPSQTDAPQTPVVHRQGRPPQSVKDDAKAMRNRVIDERLQQQSTQ